MNGSVHFGNNRIGESSGGGKNTLSNNVFSFRHRDIAFVLNSLPGGLVGANGCEDTVNYLHFLFTGQMTVLGCFLQLFALSSSSSPCPIVCALNNGVSVNF